jgi:hypothetical protein
LELGEEWSEFDKFRVFFDVAFQFAWKRFFEGVLQLEKCCLRSA